MMVSEATSSGPVSGSIGQSPNFTYREISYTFIKVDSLDGGKLFNYMATRNNPLPNGYPITYGGSPVIGVSEDFYEVGNTPNPGLFMATTVVLQDGAIGLLLLEGSQMGTVFVMDVENPTGQTVTINGTLASKSVSDRTQTLI